MPIYEISGPDGKTYSIEGPKGATRDEVIAAIKRKMSEQPEEEKPSALKTFAKRIGLGAGPAAAGFAGAEALMAAGAPLAVATGPFAPLTEAALGLAGGIGGALLAGKAQEKALEAMPETRAALGVDPETLAREQEVNPKSAFVGELVPQLATARPSISGTKALFGKGEAAAEQLSRQLGRAVSPEEAVAYSRKMAAVGAGLGGAGSVIQQELTRPGEELSLADIGEAALLGGTFTKPTRLGRAIGNLGRRAVGAEPIPYETAPPPEAAPAEPPAPTPEELAAQREQAARLAQGEKDFRGMLLDAMRDSPTIKHISEITGFDRKTAKTEMERLVADGYLTHDAKTGRYSLVPEYAQYEFVEPGAPRRTTMKEYPPEAPPEEPAAPEVSKRQMELFGPEPATPPVLYGTQEGVLSGAPMEPREQLDFFRSRAEELQRAAQQQQSDAQQAQQRERDLVMRALEKDTSIDSIRDALGVPYNQARKYMKGLEAEGIVAFKNGRWGIVPEYSQYRLPFVAGEPPRPELREYPVTPPREAEAPAAAPAPRGQLGLDFEASTAPPVEPTAPAAPKQIFDDETYSKALDAVLTNGKATAPLIQKVTGSTRSNALAFMQDLRERGVTNAKNILIGEKKAPTNAEPVVAGTERGGAGPEVPVSERGAPVGEVAESVPAGLEGARGDLAEPVVGEEPSAPALSAAEILRAQKEKTAEQLRAEVAPQILASGLGTERRLEILRSLFGKRTPQEAPRAPEPDIESMRAEYKTRAIDALDNESISEDVYNKVSERLKAPAPDFRAIDNLLTGKAEARGRREATSADIERAGMQRMTRAQQAAEAKRLEAEADRLLQESGAGDFDPNALRFQRIRNQQEETPEFKNWFGQSKVVDQTGRPQRMYHATNRDFDIFHTGTADAIFTSPDPNFTNEFLRWATPESDTSPSVMPVYVKAERPFDYDNPTHLRELKQQLLKDPYWNGDFSRIEYGDWEAIEDRVVQRAIKALGHDGFYAAENDVKNLAVYDPKQIKSAIGNRGTFDPSNPDIRYTVAGEQKGSVSHEQAIKIATEATANWRNPPNIEVSRNTAELPQHLRGLVHKDRPAFYDPSTKTVHVISENAVSPERVKADVFHESLGHYGLQEKFQSDLDSVLAKMYENPNMRRAADAWLKENADTYGHLSEPLQKARAVEEILAGRSEAGKLESSGLKGAFDRVVAAVRDWMRRHGFGVKYSDNDIAQILRQAHEGVVSKDMVASTAASFDSQIRYSMNPEAQRETDLNTLSSYASEYANKPAPTKELMRRGQETLSLVTPALRRGILSGMTTNQIANEFETAVPALRARHDALNKKGAELRKSLDYIAADVKNAHNALRKLSVRERQRVFGIFNDTTRYQVEVLNDPKREWVADKNSALYKQFNALPADVQAVYRKMRETYANQSGVTLQFLRSIMTPSQWERLVTEWKYKRLKVYLPLFREGNYWLSYTARDGEMVKRSFETPAERALGIQEAKQQGARDITPYSNVQQMMKGAPPVGFFGDVIRALDKAKVDPAVREQVVDSFLKLLPSKSVLQMARTREGTAGFEQDVVKSFANVASRQAQHIVNMKYNTELDNIMQQIREQIGTAEQLHATNPASPKSLSSEVASDLRDNVETAHQYMLNPTSSPWLAKAQYMGYVQYLGGNLSSAVIATTDLPLVSFPIISRISGFGDALGAMNRATKSFFSYHFHDGKHLPPDMARVLKQGLEDGVLGEHRAEDISEFKASGTDRYLGVKAKVDKILNAALGTADKFNREVTMLAAYELHRNKLSGTKRGDELHAAAYDAAKRDVYNAMGAVFTDTGPNLMHNGLAKTALMFKRFSLNRNYLLYKTFKEAVKGESPEVKNAALVQLLGFFGMAGLFAGVQGMPMVGWGENLASLLNSATGGDDTYDPTEKLKQSVGMLAYKGPINYFLNANASDRMGWDNMMWRDDEQRRSQVGFLTYATEQLLGPTYTYAKDLGRAYDHFAEGRVDRGLETVLPKVASNVMKAFRYGTEGATTKDGVPIKKDINAYNTFMQVLGFSPADLAEIQKENSGRIGMQKKILTARNTLIARAVSARMAEDTDGYKEIVADIIKFNQRHPGAGINGAVINQAWVRHNRKMYDSVAGVTINKKLRPEIYGAYPQDEEED